MRLRRGEPSKEGRWGSRKGACGGNGVAGKEWREGWWEVRDKDEG